MPLNGSGVYQPPAPQYPAIPNTTIYAGDFNTIINDIANALSQAVFRDGQAPLTASLNANGFGMTGIGTLAGQTAGMGLMNVASISALAAGGALTGQWAFDTTPTAPTQAPGTNNLTLATTAYVVAQAFSTALPGQSGNAGKFITTDGTNASWALVPLVTGTSGTLPLTKGGTGQTTANAALNALLPAQISQSGKVLNTDGTNTFWGFSGISTVNATITTTTTLTDYYKVVPVQMTSMGQSVTLPAATNLIVGGPVFIIDNTKGTYPAGIRDNTGVLLMAVAAGGIAYVTLNDNSTAAGAWSVIGDNLEPGLITIDNIFSSTYAATVLKPFVALGNNKSIHFLTTGTGFHAVAVDKTTGAVGTPVSVAAGIYHPCTCWMITSTTAVVFYNDSNNTNMGAVVLSLSGATTLSVGTESVATIAADAAAENFSGAPKIAQLNTTHYLWSYATATGAGTTSVKALEITSGTTVTWGAAANIITSNSIEGSTTTYALTTSTGLVLYKSGSASPYTNNAVVISVSGTTCTVGTAVSITGNAAFYDLSQPASCLLSSTKCFVASDNGASSVVVSALTISNTTITVGTAFTVESGISNMLADFTNAAATRYNPHLWTIAANTAGLWYVASGVSRVVVLTESNGAMTAGTIVYKSIASATSNAAGYGVILPQGTTEFCTLQQQIDTTAGCSLAVTTSKVSDTTITVGTSKAVRNILQTNPQYHSASRLSSGDYVLGPDSANGKSVSSVIPVFRSNGDAINMRGEISCPPLYLGVSTSTTGLYNNAVSANRVVLIGATAAQGGGTASLLRLINVEIAV